MPGEIRTRYHVTAVADGLDLRLIGMVSATNVRSSAAPVTLAKVLPAGGVTVASRAPVNMSPIARFSQAFLPAATGSA